MPIYVDCNAETPDGRFFVRQGRLLEQVEVGQVLQTHDDDGNGLVMQVDHIDRESGLVYLRPDWSTWVDGDAPRFVSAGQITFPFGLRQPREQGNALRVNGISVGLSNLAIDEAARPIVVRHRPSLPV